MWFLGSFETLHTSSNLEGNHQSPGKDRLSGVLWSRRLATVKKKHTGQERHSSQLPALQIQLRHAYVFVLESWLGHTKLWFPYLHKSYNDWSSPIDLWWVMNKVWGKHFRQSLVHCWTQPSLATMVITDTANSHHPLLFAIWQVGQVIGSSLETRKTNVAHLSRGVCL